MPHSCVLQVNRIHQVVQGDVRVATAQSGEQRSQQAEKGIDGIAAKCAEQQVKPNHIGLEPVQCTEQASRTGRIIEGPATNHVEAIQFRLSRRHPIGKNCETEKWIAAQLFGNMESVFAQSTRAGWKSGYQTNFHYFSRLVIG